MEVFIPSIVAVIPNMFVSLIGLLITGLAEKRFVSRGVVVANIFLLWQLLIPKSPTNDWIVLYLNVSIIFFVVSLYSLLSLTIPNMQYKPLEPIVHQLNYFLYSSKTVLGVAISTFLGYDFGGAVITSVILWFLAVTYLKHEVPFSS